MGFPFQHLHRLFGIRIPSHCGEAFLPLPPWQLKMMDFCDLCKILERGVSIQESIGNCLEISQECVWLLCRAKTYSLTISKTQRSLKGS